MIKNIYSSDAIKIKAKVKNKNCFKDILLIALETIAKILLNIDMTHRRSNLSNFSHNFVENSTCPAEATTKRIKKKITFLFTKHTYALLTKESKKKLEGETKICQMVNSLGCQKRMKSQHY